MADRAKSLVVTFGRVGDGAVVKSTPADSLVTPTESGLISPVQAPSSGNVYLRDGEASRRPGLGAFANNPDSLAVNGLYLSRFTRGTSWLIRGSASGSVSKYDEFNDTWVDIDGGTTFDNLTKQVWSFCMGPRIATASNRNDQLIIGNPTSLLYKWTGTGTITTLSTDAPRNVGTLVRFLDRVWAFDVTDATTGERNTQRSQYSVVLDSQDWLGIGSGTLDLAADPYPMMNAMEIAGRLSVFKGNAQGGAIYVLTPTGSSVSPVRVDAVNPGTNVGLLFKRSLVSLSPALAFFIGHDAAYLFDGARGLVPFANGVVEYILENANLDVLDLAWAVYDPVEREVEFCYAPSGSDTPTESWVFDVDNRRAHGPHTYSTGITAATRFTALGQTSWGSFGQGVPRTWDTLLNNAGTAQYFQWDNINEGASARSTVYGLASGACAQRTGSEADDLGTDIACTYELPPITSDGWLILSGQGAQRLRHDDTLVLREVVLRHRSSAAWTPVVEVSTNGTSWTAVDDDVALANTNGRVLSSTYYCAIPGVWHQVRVRNADGENLNIYGVTLVFTYAGSSRHE